MDDLIAASMVGQQETAQRLGLNVTDLTCFAYVLQAGEHLLTAGEPATRVQVTTGAVTGILNRLERAGYVTRRPAPHDRRRVRVAAYADRAVRRLTHQVHQGKRKRPRISPGPLVTVHSAGFEPATF
ncbi:MarR family winged helix-turn-helix transcriptional regulator [Streptomyces antibioticus]|uniref:MarR family winged helix-turn-helix transcriptional regulator n=1 Tax=Streptomyces antibioticus TaxID=1890 RepID=UPI00368F916B